MIVNIFVHQFIEFNLEIKYMFIPLDKPMLTISRAWHILIKPKIALFQ